MSLKNVAQETLTLLENGRFSTPAGKLVQFAAEQETAVSGTRLYTPEQLQTLLDTPASGEITQLPTITVTDETTQVAARRLVQDEGYTDLALLNFASARNPGGGFLNGAKAQEEDITRCSGLYPCLITQPHYYAANRAHKSLLYTDHIIYSPSVPFFRTRSRDAPHTLFLASVITAPAPNAGEVLRRQHEAQPNIEAALRRRAGMVLAVARDQGHRNLLLGAWGCGVFRNDPHLVADAFGQWLQTAAFAHSFERVVFAVYDPRKKQVVLEAFRARFS